MTKETEEIKERLERVISKELNKIDEREDKIKVFDYLFNVYKILENYDELEPTLTQFFCEKARKDKCNREK